MLVVRRIALALACLLLMGQSTMSPSGGIITPPSGLVVPVTPSTIGAAGLMTAACPPAEYLTQITDTGFTCQPAGEGPGSVPDSALVSSYSGVGACTAGEFVTALTRNASPTCATPSGGGTPIPPGTVNQLLGYDNNNNPENQTVGGGNGNCIYTRTNANYGSITCSNYATFGGGQFTGTVASPVFYVAGPSGAAGTIQAPAGSIYNQPGYVASNPTQQGQWTINGLLNLPAITLGGAGQMPFGVDVPTAGGYYVNGQPQNLNSFSGTVTDAQIGPNYSGVGACISGAFVTALQRNNTPICLTPAYAPLTNPTGGQNNYAPLASPTFTGTVTIPVINLSLSGGGVMGVSGAGIALGGTVLRPNSFNIPTSGQYLINDAPLAFSNLAGTVTDAQLASAYSGIGTCPAGDVITALTRNGAPTCTTISGSGGAPLVNPAGGQNNYAAIASPTFTGIVTSPQVSLSVGLSGTAAAVYNQPGYNSTTLAGQWNVNGLQNIPALSIGNATLIANSINLPTGGQYLINGSPINGLFAPLTNPAGGQNNYAPIASPTFTGSQFTLNQSSTGIVFQSPTSITGNITNAGTASNFLGLLAGVHYTGTNYILDSTTPMGIVMNGQTAFYGGSGAIGSTWAPQMIGYFNNTGLTMNSGTLLTTPSELLTTEATTGNSIYMGPSRTSPYATILANQTSGYNQTVLSTGAHSTGSWVADSVNAVISQFAGGNSTTPPAIVDYINTSLTVGNTFTPTQTLILHPTATTIPTLTVNNYSSTGLEVGDAFLSSTGTAVFNLSGGTYWTGTQWIANSTSSGYTTISGSSSGMSVYIIGAGTAGSSAPAGAEMQRTDTNGVHVSHMMGNLSGFTPSFANGTPLAGVSDSYGFVFANAWPVTITFSHPYVGTAACVATSMENGATMYIGGNTTTAMQFGCFGVGGGACPGLWFTYHCFGVG